MKTRPNHSWRTLIGVDADDDGARPCRGERRLLTAKPLSVESIQTIDRMIRSEQFGRLQALLAPI